MKKLVFLLEEPSSKELLKSLLPRISDEFEIFIIKVNKSKSFNVMIDSILNIA